MGRPSKVNDRDGNPIEISAVVVWRVVNTAEAIFEVDDYEDFVAVQSEAALREAEQKHGEALASLQAHAAEHRSQQEAHGKELSAASAELDQIAQQHERDLQQLETQHREQREADRVGYAAERTSAEMAAASQAVDDAKQLHDKELEVVASKHAAELDSLVQQHRAELDKAEQVIYQLCMFIQPLMHIQQ